MSKAKRYLGKAVYHIFKYFVCPFLTLLSAMFFLLVSLNFLSKYPANTNYLLFVEISSVFSLLVAVPIFLIESMTLLPRILRRHERINLLFGKHFPKIGRISIKTRIELKPYLLTLGLSTFFLAIAVLIKFDQTNALPPQFSSLDFWIFFFSYMGAPLFLTTYFRLYEQEEKAIFLLDRFFRRIDFCLNEPRIGLSVADFENALKSYQKTLPSFYSLNNLKERVRQAQLILDRGTRDEITKMQYLVFSLSSSIKMHDVPSFDNHFQELCQFLEQKENEERNVLTISQSNKDRLRNFVNKVSSIFADRIVARSFPLYNLRYFWTKNINIYID